MTRPDGRTSDELRPFEFQRDFTTMADGSCLVSFGNTRVLCTASIDEDVPRWMRGSGKGWVTAEYSMLPGSSPERVGREAAKGKQSGRTVEIQRLIGRSLRAACDMKALGERQVIVDCDVIQADGGTRTASICGGYVALHDALTRVVQRGGLSKHPLHSFCSAISVGIVGGEPVLDLPYVEDSAAEVDMNVVMLAPADGGEARFVEVQGTAEGHGLHPWRARLRCLALAEGGLARIAEAQRELVATTGAAGTGLTPAWASCRDWSAPRRTPTRSPRSPRSSTGVVELVPRPDDVGDVVEDADTLEGNARLKAVAICDATGLAAVADDTGLEVDALDGAPGVDARALRRGGLLVRRQPCQAAARARRCRRPVGTIPYVCARPLARRSRAGRRRGLHRHDQRGRPRCPGVRLRRRCSCPTRAADEPSPR